MEVFTIGGGEYLIRVFNAVAAWAAADDYLGMIKVALIFGLIMSLLYAAFARQFMSMLQWFISSVLMYTMLIVPTQSVTVTDEINPDLAARTIDNVPLGLALIASVTSQFGNYLTNAAEVVFADPADLDYSTNGFIYGNRLYQAVHEFRVQDSEFAGNLDEFMQQCVFYDILLNRYTFDDLKTSGDIWQFFNDQGMSPARSVRQVNGGVPSIVTCAQAYTAMTPIWAAEVGRASQIYGVQIFPNLTPAAASAKLIASLPIANEYFLGAAKEADITMRQAMLSHAVNAASDNFVGSSGVTAVDAYAQARAELQTEQTYVAISRQAQKWVPILRNVLEVLFYGLFLVLFPLFLLPNTGISLLKGYTVGFLFLQAWGPIYVILHMMLMYQAAEGIFGAAHVGPAAQDYALATIAGIKAVNSDISVMAGYMLMSVPFIAGSLAYGARGIANQSAAFLSPSQRAAEEAAREASTGNIAVGNAQLGNATLSTVTANKLDTRPVSVTGAAQWTQHFAGGGSRTTFQSGHSTYDGGGTVSNFGAFGTSLSQSLSAYAGQKSSELRSQSHSRLRQSDKAYSEAASHFMDLSKGFSSQRSASSGSGTSSSQAFEDLQSEIDQFSKRYGERGSVDYQVAQTAAASLALGAGGRGANRSTMKRRAMGAIGRTIGLSLDANLSQLSNRQTSGGLSYSEIVDSALDYTSREQFSNKVDAWNKVESSRLSSAERATRDSVQNSLSESDTYRNMAQSLQDRVNRYEKDWSRNEGDTVGFQKDLANELQQYLFSETVAQRIKSDPSLPNDFDPRAGDVVSADPAKQEVTEGLIQEFLEMKKRDIDRQMAGLGPSDMSAASSFVPDQRVNYTRMVPQPTGAKILIDETEDRLGSLGELVEVEEAAVTERRAGTGKVIQDIIRDGRRQTQTGGAGSISLDSPVETIRDDQKRLDQEAADGSRETSWDEDVTGWRFGNAKKPK